jgi:hypothetical protein
MDQTGQTFEARKEHSGREAGGNCDSSDRSQFSPRAPPIAGLLWCRHWKKQERPGSHDPLLGFEAVRPVLSCTISVPNLKTDRHIGLIIIDFGVDVRRLMYQLLICR